MLKLQQLHSCHSSQSVVDPQHRINRPTWARHPLHIAVTVSAHVEQKRECPQGTKAMPDRGTRRQTLQQSAISGDDDVGAAVAWVAAATWSKWAARVNMQSVCLFYACYDWRQAQFHRPTFKMLTFGLPFSRLPTSGLPFSAPLKSSQNTVKNDSICNK